MGPIRAVQCLAFGTLAPKFTHFTLRLQRFSQIALSEGMSRNIHPEPYLAQIGSSERVTMPHAPIIHANTVGCRWADPFFMVLTFSILAVFGVSGGYRNGR